MPPKRPHPDTDTDTGLMPPPPPPSSSTSTPSAKRRQLNVETPSIPAPPTLFFTIPHPPLLPDDPPPSNGQFTDFLHAQAATLPPSTHSLYIAALANLEPDSTPELTSEMRASLKAAVTAFTVHLSPAADQDQVEVHEKLGFLRRLAAGEVRDRELVDWADTITAALMSFSATGGAPAPPSASPAPSASSTTATGSRARPTQSVLTPPEMHSSTHHSPTGRSAAIRNRTLARDGHTCVVTGVPDADVLEVAHIIPFSVRGEKAAAFWGLLGIFMGAERLEVLRTATLQLAGSASGSVEILPVVGSGEWDVGREYDPSVVSSYDISIHYPGSAALPPHQTGQQLLSIALLTPGTTITLTTPDPATMPLPHPLLLQLHAVCGRIKRLRAAAGWPVLPPGDGEDGEQFQWGEEEEIQWEEEEDDIGGSGEGRSETVVMRFSAEEGISDWVQGCSLPVDGDSRVDPAAGAEGSGVERRDNKRKFGDGLEQLGELEEGPEDGERPRKVAAVFGEMEMREAERRRLVGRRGGSRGLGM